MPITRNFTLYLNAGISVAPTVHVNQSDRGEQWIFTLLDDKGQKYTPSDGALIGVKADGHAIVGVTGTVGSDGNVYITETQQMTAAAGKAIFELTIDGMTHGTANFIVQVEKKPTEDAVLSESDLSIIQQGIDSVTPAAINETVSEYLAEHMTNPPIDPTLTVSNAAADAKVTGDKITELKTAIDKLATGEDFPYDVDFTFTNGYRIYKNGNVLSVLQAAVNYGYTEFIPVTAGKTYNINPASGIKYYWYNTDVSALDTTITHVEQSAGWSAVDSSIIAQYPYLCISYYKEDGTALSANTPYLSVTENGETAYVLKDRLTSYLYPYPTKEDLVNYLSEDGTLEIDTPYVNGTRIYRNGNKFTYFSSAVNYGYVNFPKLEVNRKYTINAPSGIKYYVYNCDASALDEEFTNLISTNQWESGSIDFVPTYEYLCISYYKEDGTALGNDRIITIEIDSDEDGRKAAINEIKSIAEAVKDELYLGNASVYRVGANRTYTTINSALTQWANDGYPKAVVYIDNGEYNETVYVEDKNISFIGESRDGVIVRTKTGNYTYPPFKIHHGNVLVANLTAIADHSDNPSFVDGENGAYAFHIDGGTIGGVVTVRNCTAISYQSCAFGMGTIPNAKIRIEDCTAISYTNAGATALGLGCILNHLASPSVYPTLSEYETLELVNVKMYSENADTVLVMNRGNNNTTTYKILAINTVIASGSADENLVSMPNNPYQIEALSTGNTETKLNA